MNEWRYVHREEAMGYHSHMNYISDRAQDNRIAYGYLITMAVKGEISAAQFLLFFSAVSGFAGYLTNILDNCIKLYKQSLDICKVREYLEWPEPFCMDHGEIVQQGSHEELVAAKSGKYAQLWYAQAQYYT